MKLVEDEYLRSQLFKRLKELEWKDVDLFNDAASKGIKIEASRWAKYKKNRSGQITDDTLLWICTRIGINVSLHYGEPIFNGTNIVWVIPPYDQEKCLQRLDLIFSKNG